MKKRNKKAKAKAKKKAKRVARRNVKTKIKTFKKTLKKKAKPQRKPQTVQIKKEEFRGVVGMFCPKCGSLLIPKNDGGKRILACKCGFSTHETKEAKLKEVMEEKKAVEIVEKEHEPHPLTPAECPKCKHKMAYYWTVQTRASDEPETKFLKCEKCEHVWRDYS